MWARNNLLLGTCAELSAARFVVMATAPCFSCAEDYANSRLLSQAFCSRLRSSCSFQANCALDPSPWTTAAPSVRGSQNTCARATHPALYVPGAPLDILHAPTGPVSRYVVPNNDIAPRPRRASDGQHSRKRRVIAATSTGSSRGCWYARARAGAAVRSTRQTPQRRGYLSQSLMDSPN